MASNHTTQRPRERVAGCLQALLFPLIIIGIIGAWNYYQDDKDNSSSSSSSSSSSPDEKSGEWKAGDCGGPDPDGSADAYKAFDCDDSGATFKALKIMDASILPDAVQCPAGTDLIVQVSITFGSSGSGGIPSSTVCGRNLSGDHPGDAGAGGGQLVKGDCIDNTAKEIACAQAGAADYKVLDLVKTEAECPSATTDPLKLTLALGRPYDVICATKAA
ncbi:hypothetical protein N4P33_10115 [Streptomyces sp. 15-116A]|uniref:hypothetical protein n=1 Tax=Streptomyces sp. 15-116A TaxID=2259035 RepID=UPI0021B296B9|nr:hypothetical protein [Streptomyces sp. 15-116A]MCT7352527.1 hypothetical protein [Streptomyces sp. 15-116A]